MRRRVARRGHPAAFAASLVIVACAPGEATPASALRTDSAGVTIAVNDSVDRPLAWTFTERFSLGGEESGPASFYSLWSQAVDVDAAGNLYVLDAPNHRVVVFDSAGAFVRTFGGEGGGPGEMQRPWNLSVTGDGTVSVYDFAKRGLVRFAAEGAPLPPRTIIAEGGAPLDGLRATTTGLIALRRVYGDEAGVRVELATGDSLTHVVASVLQAQGTMHMYSACGGGLNLPPIFEPEIVWDGADDLLAVNAEAGYVVDLYRGASRVASYRRGTAPRPATPELAARELGEGMRVDFGRGPCVLPVDETVEARGTAALVPAIGRLTLAPDGELWVERRTVGDEPRLIDVFTADGDYRGTLGAGAPAPIAFLPSGDVIAIEQDDFDIERLVVYRVARDAAPDAPR